MDKQRILIVGLEEAEVNAIKQNLGFNYLTVQYDQVPQVKLIDRQLFVESPSVPDKYLLVDKVIFHGIYDDDFDFITLLALWNGPCLPNAIGMMDLRQRIPGLVRALSVSTYSGIKEEWLLAARNILPLLTLWLSGAFGIAAKIKAGLQATGQAVKLRLLKNLLKAKLYELCW